jgi:hypothetical protein
MRLTGSDTCDEDRPHGPEAQSGSQVLARELQHFVQAAIPFKIACQIVDEVFLSHKHSCAVFANAIRI